MIIEFNSHEKVIEILKWKYGREVDAEEIPTQTDEVYIGWGIKRMLQDLSKSFKINKATLTINNEDTIL